MDYQAIIDKYYPEDNELKALLLKHSRQVADKCLEACRKHPELNLDEQFVEEAAMLHDIGIRWCHAPSILCMGDQHYIRHGVIGGELLRKEGPFQRRKSWFAMPISSSRSQVLIVCVRWNRRHRVWRNSDTREWKSSSLGQKCSNKQR